MRAWTAGNAGTGEKRGRHGWAQPRQPSPTGLTTVLGVGSTPPLMSWLLGSLRPSSRALPAPGPFLRFSLARMDDSRSGKGGISSSTVACGVGAGGLGGRSRSGTGVPGRRRGQRCRGGARGDWGSDQDVRAGHRAKGEVYLFHCHRPSLRVSDQLH